MTIGTIMSGGTEGMLVSIVPSTRREGGKVVSVSVSTFIEDKFNCSGGSAFGVGACSLDASPLLVGGAGAVGNAGNGCDVNGGGKGVLDSPLTLRLSGGSREVPLAFDPLPLIFNPSFPTFASLNFASRPSNRCSNFGSTLQKYPFPLSPAHRSNFLKALLPERLCRTEL